MRARMRLPVRAVMSLLALAALAGSAALFVALVLWIDRAEPVDGTAPSGAADPVQIERGRVLALAGQPDARCRQRPRALDPRPVLARFVIPHEPLLC